jgi:hypothetical protein
MEHVAWLAVGLPVLGGAWCLVFIVTTLFAALVYRGGRGERYSPLNHFISELGETGVSSGARVFNSGLVGGGILMIPYLVFLGLLIPDVWARLAMITGLWAAVSCSLVGIFPMNNLSPHIRVAMSFFRSGLVTVILFTLALWLQPVERVPRLLAVGGLAAAAAYSAFLIFVALKLTLTGERMEERHFLTPEVLAQRPKFWTVSAMEWMIYMLTLIWLLAIGLSVR